MDPVEQTTIYVLDHRNAGRAALRERTKFNVPDRTPEEPPKNGEHALASP